MKRYTPFIIIVVVAALTLAAGAWLYRAKVPASTGHGAAASSGTTTPDTSTADDTRSKAGPTAAAAGGIKPIHVRGTDEAPVSLEEYGDFQCPSCASTTALIHTLLKDYEPRVRLVFRNFPLPMHQHARLAAIAAEAAGFQGRFWEMHDLLYQNQLEWSKSDDARGKLDDYASRLQLDLDKFRRDMESVRAAALVDEQQAHGKKRGVKATPTLFVNGVLLPPPFTAERLREAIDGALGEKKDPKREESPRAEN